MEYDRDDRADASPLRLLAVRTLDHRKRTRRSFDPGRPPLRQIRPHLDRVQSRNQRSSVAVPRERGSALRAAVARARVAVQVPLFGTAADRPPRALLRQHRLRLRLLLRHVGGGDDADASLRLRSARTAEREAARDSRRDAAAKLPFRRAGQLRLRTGSRAARTDRRRRRARIASRLGRALRLHQREPDRRRQPSGRLLRLPVRVDRSRRSTTTRI
jgi:hypothetical protein